MLHLTNISTAAPVASLFVPPVGYRVYTDIQAMMQTEMMKKMGGTTPGGVPGNHTAMPPGHP